MLDEQTWPTIGIAVIPNGLWPTQSPDPNPLEAPPMAGGGTGRNCERNGTLDSVYFGGARSLRGSYSAYNTHPRFPYDFKGK